MADDTELQLLTDMGNIKKELSSLKKRLTRLSKRVDILELSGLQDQITFLNSNITNLNNTFINMQREIARLSIHHQLLWALWVLIPQQRSQTPQTVVDASYCIQFVRESALAALTRAAYSDNPNDTYSEWYSGCENYFKAHGYPDLFPPA